MIGDVHIGFGEDTTLNEARDRIVELEADLARLRAAAAGRGMVCEQENWEDVAVLVVGLHQRIARLQDDLQSVAEALQHRLKRHPPECDCADCALLSIPGVRAVLDQQSC